MLVEKGEEDSVSSIQPAVTRWQPAFFLYTYLYILYCVIGKEYRYIILIISKKAGPAG
jgi:hypothetical protein